MMKKFLLIETTLLSAFIAVLMTCASLSTSHDDTISAEIDIQSSVQSASHASTSYHSIYKLGGVYPEP
jgi:hypothetical protein